MGLIKNIKQLMSTKNKTVDIGTPELNRALFEYLTTNISFFTDNNTYKYIENGYEKNPDVFSIADHISTRFASVELCPYNLKTGEKVDLDPIKDLFDSNSIDKTFFEFKKEWELFNLISGNSIVHTPFYKFGNMTGQVMKLANLPTQNIEIESGGRGRVIGAYKFNIGDTRNKIDPSEIWHSRMFLNLNYDGGKNFMGISPIRVAAKIIDTQNNGYDLTSNTYKNTLPPVIINFKNRQAELTPEQRSQYEKIWDKKTGVDKAGKPFFTGGDLNVHKLGYENFKDLQLIENSENGIRILCRVWSVPSQLFNDTKASTYNNVKESKKDMYEGRIIPDMDMFVDGMNRLVRSSGIYYTPEWSKVPSLQQDMLDKARIYDIGIKNRSVMPNEFRVDVLGKEELTPEQLEELQMQGEFTNLPNDLQNLLEENRL